MKFATLRFAVAACAAEELASELLGYSVRKAVDPLSEEGFLLIGEATAAALAKATAGAEAQVVAEVISKLGIDWKKLTPEAAARATGALNTAISASYNAKVLPKVNGVLEVEGPSIMKGTKSALIAREKISISGNLAQRDLEAEAAIRKTNVNFVRRSSGERAGDLSAKARDIVSRGLSQGLGSDVISSNLRKHYSETIPRPDSYWRVVADSFIGRARTTSQIYGYEDAGIETFEVVAVIDEVTTDQCRYMDGKTFSVASTRGLLDSLNEMSDPEDVEYKNPWIRKGKDPEGGSRLYVPHADGSTTTIAKIEQSAVGTADEKGKFSSGKNSSELMSLGVPCPPFHARCRTTIVASSDSAESGAGTMVPGADLEDTTAPTPANDTTEPAVAVEPDVPPEHTPEYWESEYEDEYGEAKKAMAWGRAAEERGLALDLEEASTEFGAMQKTDGVFETISDGNAFDTLKVLPETKAKKFKNVGQAARALDKLAKKQTDEFERTRFENLAAEVRLAGAVVAHRRSIERGPVSFATELAANIPQLYKNRITNSVEDATKVYSAMTSKTVKLPTYPIVADTKTKRGYHLPTKIGIGDAAASRDKIAKVIVHEVGHAIEYLNPKLAANAESYLKARTAGEAPQKLSKIFPSHGYNPSEVTRPDKLFSPYAGKEYVQFGKTVATEITSMTAESLGSINDARALYKTDRDSFLFLLGQLADQ